ncbi:hypothetical protein ACFL0E_00915 [Nanoarchaeota archaeon]
MGLKKVIKVILKNFLVFTLGGFVGLIIGVILAMIWMKTAGPSVGLGIIALAPFMLVLFSLMGFVIGGVLGLIIYNIIKIKRRK